jgi:hypothetical protein
MGEKQIFMDLFHASTISKIQMLQFEKYGIRILTIGQCVNLAILFEECFQGLARSTVFFF